MECIRSRRIRLAPSCNLRRRSSKAKQEAHREHLHGTGGTGDNLSCIAGSSSWVSSATGNPGNWLTYLLHDVWNPKISVKFRPNWQSTQQFNTGGTFGRYLPPFVRDNRRLQEYCMSEDMICPWDWYGQKPLGFPLPIPSVVACIHSPAAVRGFVRSCHCSVLLLPCEEAEEVNNMHKDSYHHHRPASTNHYKVCNLHAHRTGLSPQHSSCMRPTAIIFVMSTQCIYFFHLRIRKWFRRSMARNYAKCWL